MLHYCHVHPTYNIFTSLGFQNLQTGVQIFFKMYEAHFNPKLVNITLSEATLLSPGDSINPWGFERHQNLSTGTPSATRNLVIK
jgi:hypothetical protein